MNSYVKITFICPVCHKKAEPVKISKRRTVFKCEDNHIIPKDKICFSIN